MESHPSLNTELYNLRWNSYSTNLIRVCSELQHLEALVDVTLSCEGKFIKAHRLVLSACSTYFQTIFETHTDPHILILLNDIEFRNLQLVLEFMYSGEVKVADAELQKFLALGKFLQVKGLCAVELREPQNPQVAVVKSDGKVEELQEKSSGMAKMAQEDSPEKVPEDLSCKRPLVEKEVASQTVAVQDIASKTINVAEQCANAALRPPKRIKLIMPQGADLATLLSPLPQKKRLKVENTSGGPSDDYEKKMTPSVINFQPGQVQDTSVTSSPPHIPRPPNAFMIFANQWRKKLAVEHPDESNKAISMRLGSMWKSLSPETRDAFYDEAKKAEEDHKLKYPGYYYSPKEARRRKAEANGSKSRQDSNDTVANREMNDVNKK